MTTVFKARKIITMDHNCPGATHVTVRMEGDPVFTWGFDPNVLPRARLNSPDLGQVLTAHSFGKRADLCVLDRDPFSVAPEALREVTQIAAVISVLSGQETQ